MLYGCRKKITDLENKVALLLERVEDLELIIKEYNNELRTGLGNENLISLREVKLASALQNKPLLTREEVRISLSISKSTLDKWSRPLKNEEEERGDRVYLRPTKSRNSVFKYLADLKSASIKQLGGGDDKFFQLLKGGGYVSTDEKDMFLKLLTEKIIGGAE